MERRDQTKLIEVVKQTIESTVNGKIIDLHRKFDGYVNEDIKWKNNVNLALEELKPVNTGIAWLKSTKIGASFVAGFLIPIGVIFGVIWQIVHFIRGS